MYADISKPPKAIPKPQPKTIQLGITLLPPLSRRGRGPGLILLVPDSNSQLTITDGVSSAIIKWVEEGYTVVTLQASALKTESSASIPRQSIATLTSCKQCDTKDKIGLVAYDPGLFNLVAHALSSISEIVGAVTYADAGNSSSIPEAGVPVLYHFSGPKVGEANKKAAVTEYYYSNVKSFSFATPFQEYFNYTTEAVSHTRNLTFLKKLMNGPFFELEDIWDEHTYYEFEDRSVEHTMSTMVQELYVNHVPAMTGGIGRSNFTDFYRNNFIFNNSADTELELISRTIGIDRIVDEFIFKFTHDRELDWLLPGLPPTHRKLELAFCAVVNIRGDRLYHEHISWDQGSALRQLGLMLEYLPFPYPLPNGRAPSTGKLFYYKVPVAGIETAEKMKDRGSVASNEMFKFQVIEK